MSVDVDQQEFDRLMAAVRDGSEEAAAKLVAEFGPHVRRSIRRRLRGPMRRQFDSLDFVQMMWASLARGQDRLMQASTPGQFVALLTTIARNKLTDQIRRSPPQREEAAPFQEDADKVCDSEATSREPSPSQVAIAQELWGQMTGHQTERDRQILQCKAAGETCVRIAEKLGVNERTVRRVLKRVLQDLGDS